MTQDLLNRLHQNFGTVSSKTETSGIVAVRNKTALKSLQVICSEHGATATPKTNATTFPQLVTVTQTV